MKCDSRSYALLPAIVLGFYLGMADHLIAANCERTADDFPRHIGDIVVTSSRLQRLVLGGFWEKVIEGTQPAKEAPIAPFQEKSYEVYLKTRAYDDRKLYQPYGKLQIPKERLAGRGEFATGSYDPALWNEVNLIVFHYDDILNSGYVALENNSVWGSRGIRFSQYDGANRRFCGDCDFTEMEIDHPGRVINLNTGIRQDGYLETHDWTNNYSVRRQASPMNDFDILRIIDSAIETSKISWTTFEKVKTFGYTYQDVMEKRPSSIELGVSQIERLKVLRDKINQRSEIKVLFQFVGTASLAFTLQDLVGMPLGTTAAEKVRLQVAKVLLNRSLANSEKNAIVTYTRALHRRAQELAHRSPSFEQTLREVRSGSNANKQLLLKAGFQPAEISQLILSGVI